MQSLLMSAPIAGAVALLLAIIFIYRVKLLPAGNDRMVEISGMIRDGSMTFLYREYKILFVYCLVLFVVLALSALGVATAASFLLGALLSLFAGYLGMTAATLANVRTAEAARTHGRGKAFMAAFDGGAVMGLCVAGLGLLGMGGIFYAYHESDLFNNVIHGFGVGSSSIALFARIGGGIYTKAADVGADLAGKVIAGIPEDDPRNPGVIADNVGDNVGDVAGMGADIFESYVAATIAAIALAVTMAPISLEMLTTNLGRYSSEDLRFVAKYLPIGLATVGLIVSVITIFLVRLFKDKSPAAVLRWALLLPPVIFIGIMAVILNAFELTTNIVWVIAAGAIGGGIIGLITDYYTSGAPVRRIVKSSLTGSGTNVIEGLAVGLESVIAPMFVIATVAFISFKQLDLYGIAIAAVSMLAVTAMVMAVDAYGPISDNAGGIAEFTELGSEVRDITDELDAVGNTTAAIGKGFAIGSAVLTVIALFAAFKSEIDHIRPGGLSLELTDGRVLVGLLIGGILPCIVGASTMTAVGKAAGAIVEEIGRQFREIAGLLEGKPGVKPDSSRCVDLATKAALREMLLPGCVAIIFPPIVGFVLGAEALAGMLAGAMVVGAVLSLFMANAGGAWDNAKKMIEKDGIEGQKKGSEAHKAAVVGDTVGDPFKDTSGPGISILIKVMSVVSLMIASLIALRDGIF